LDATLLESGYIMSLDRNKETQITGQY